MTPDAASVGSFSGWLEDEGRSAGRRWWEGTP